MSIIPNARQFQNAYKFIKYKSGATAPLHLNHFEIILLHKKCNFHLEFVIDCFVTQVIKE
jgi:hypothetical protein